MARSTSRPPTSGIRRSTITRSARRVCSCAIASRPLEQAIASISGPLREAADHIENALLVVDDDEQRLLPVHTHSLETRADAPREAPAVRNGGARTASPAPSEPFHVAVVASSRSAPAGSRPRRRARRATPPDRRRSGAVDERHVERRVPADAPAHRALAPRSRRRSPSRRAPPRRSRARSGRGARRAIVPAPGSSLRAGSSSLNVVPCPTRLSTEICPP